jgi:hypothetical protein
MTGAASCVRRPGKKLHTTAPTQYPPFSVVVELDGHLAEGLAHRILAVHVLQALRHARPAEPVLPHQHPASTHAPPEYD